ncbi:MAG: hypothetical protein HQ592_03000, partial [Planctomycetes bacterium]|nr:hypothetical protein [Planctomycetota bacterium]
MLKKIVAAIILIGAASFLAVQIGTSAPDSSREPAFLATVKRASFDVAIIESGVLEALRSVTLCSEIPSNNAKIVYLVSEGTQVEKGDVLVSFDPTPFQEDIRKLQYQANEAKALLEEAQQEVQLEDIRAGQERLAAKHASRLAELQLENVLKGEGPVLLEEARNNSIQAKTKMERAGGHAASLQEIYEEEEGFITKEELAKARNAAEEAEAAFELAKLRFEKRRDYMYPAEKEKARAELAKAQNEAGQLELALKHRRAKIAAAHARMQATVRSARDRLQTATALLTKTAIRAPIPGFVVYREAYH